MVNNKEKGCRETWTCRTQVVEKLIVVVGPVAVELAEGLDMRLAGNDGRGGGHGGREEKGGLHCGGGTRYFVTVNTGNTP